MNKARTRIQYRADSANAYGWLERSLQPSGNLTSILAETSSWKRNPRVPQVGDRVREFENLATPGKGATHGQDSAWKVIRVEHFTSQDTDDQIIVCYCEYAPINAEWQELKRGAPVNELLEEAVEA